MRIEIDRRNNIFCPFYNHKQDNETKYLHVSYWGEDPPKDCICEHCNKHFFVKEQVDRRFYSSKTEEELNDY